MSVNHLFAINEVIGLRDEVHQWGKATWPIIEYGIDVLCLWRLEVNDTVKSVHLSRDSFARNQIGQKLFRFLDRQVKERRHPLHRHTGVVLSHNTDIVFDNAGLEGLPAFLTLLSTFNQIVKLACVFFLENYFIQPTNGEDVGCWCGSVSHSKNLLILLA